MNDYKPNSHKSKTEQAQEKKVNKPVVQGTVKTRKRSGARKFADVFISEDIESVKSYIMSDVLIPAIKKTILDVVDTILYPGSDRRDRKKTNASNISYARCYDNRDDYRRAYDSRQVRVGYSYDDIVLASRGDADEVLSRMDELLDSYPTVSVADLYDLIGKTGNYTDNKYGWTNLSSASVVRVRDGYMLKLPKATMLD